MRKRRPKADPQIERSADRPSDIVRVAASLFSERGYSGTTVREIGAAVGLTSGALFHHFATKEDILLSVVDTGIKQSIELVEQETSSDDDPRRRLRAMVHAHLRALLEGAPETKSIMFYEWWSLSPVARQQVIELRNRYEAIWDKAIEEIDGPAGQPGDRSIKRLLLIGAMNWATQWYSPGGRLVIDQIADRLMDIYFPLRA